MIRFCSIRTLQLLLSLMVILACSTALSAAPPTVTNMTPRGAERGKPVEIVVAGANLTPQTRLILPFTAVWSLLPDAKPNPALVRFQLTVEPSVPLGIYPVRVATEDGVSSLFFFSVDAFPNANEVEDNNTFDKAQKVSLPVIITGQCAGGDVDFFRFTAKKGQRLVIETEAARLGSAVLPQIRVTDGEKRFLAADDSQALRGDCRVSFVAAADGDYVVEISDARYRGGNPPHYRLKIAEYDVVEEVFPLGGRRGETVEFTLRGGTLSGDVRVKRSLDDALSKNGTMRLGLDGAIKIGMLSPQVVVGDLPERTWIKTEAKDGKPLKVTPPLTVNGRLERKGDVDRFQLAVQPGQRFRFAVEAESLGSYLDGVLRVTDQAGKQLALVDDVDVPPAAPGLPATKSADPVVDLTVPAGVTMLVAELRDQRHRGGVNFGYRLTIEPVEPDFWVQQTVAEVNVPRGGSVLLTVLVARRGFTGPIQLTATDLPPGISVQGGHVPANGVTGVLTLSAAADAPAPEQPCSLRIEGKATIDGKEIRRWAYQKLVLNRDANVSTALLTLPHFALGLTSAQPFGVQGPPTIELVKGYPATVPVAVTRANDQAMLAVEVTGLVPAAALAAGQPPPPGLFAAKPANAAAGAASTGFTITAAVNAPEGTLDLVIQGKARIGNADRIVTGPAVPLSVVKPFAVELATADLKLVPGQTVALKGKLLRQPVFKEAVQLRLDGLPRGVTLAAPPKPLPGDATEFQIDLQVDPKAAAATANLTLTCSTTINGTAYAHPPVIVPAQVVPGK